MSAGGGGSTSDSKTHSQENQNTSGTGTQTPTNLPFLQAGWDQAGNILGATSGQTPGLASDALNMTSAANPLASTTASAGATAASDFANGAHATNDANQYLTPYANGSQVGTQNPGFQGVVNQTALALQPQVDGSFGAAGRYGSGANANAFATALTNETGNLSFQNYIQQQANQLQAAGQLSNNNATGTAQQLQGAGLTPSTTSNLYAPATATATAAYAPLLAYIQAITAGNGGGTQTTAGNTNLTGNTHTLTNEIHGGGSFSL